MLSVRWHGGWSGSWRSTPASARPTVRTGPGRVGDRWQLRSGHPGGCNRCPGTGAADPGLTGCSGRGSRWPSRWRAAGWCGDRCGILPPWPACSSGSWLGAPVSGQLLGQTRLPKRIAFGVLQVLADRDRIARDPYEHVIGWLCGIGLAVHGTQHLAKSPAVAARIANHIDHSTTSSPRSAPQSSTCTPIRPIPRDWAARYTTSSRRSPRTPSRARSNDRTNVTIFGSGNMGTAVDVTIEAVGGARRPSR